MTRTRTDLPRIHAKALHPVFGKTSASSTKTSSAGPINPPDQFDPTTATPRGRDFSGTELRFYGLDGYKPFRNALRSLLVTCEAYYPASHWRTVGLDHPFGTRIDDAKPLVGTTISGVDLRVEGTVREPLVEAQVNVFQGSVESVHNANDTGPDPIWIATLRDTEGNKRIINLSDARGLRVDRATVSPTETFDHGSGLDRLRARAKTLKEFGQQYQSPSTAIPDRLSARLAKLPAETREKIIAYQVRLTEQLSGKADGATACLHRTADDQAMRPLYQINDESMRPIIEETQKMLYDSEGVHGFNQWLGTLAAEIAVDLAESGKLKWTDRDQEFMDAHENFPWTEGKPFIPRETITLEQVPKIHAADVKRALDRRIVEMGFDAHLDKFKDMEKSKGSKYIPVLKGASLKETTPAFIELTRNNTLFDDHYFVGKPHGRYSHIFQWLYLADRMRDPQQNDFHANMHPAFMNTVSAELMSPGPTAVYVTDQVGQRSPQNPDHVNNSVRMIFDTVED